MPPANGPPILDVPTSSLIRTCRDTPPEREGFPSLLESVRERGSFITPLFVSKPIEVAGKPVSEWFRKIWEGNSRHVIAELLGFPTVPAIEIDGIKTRAELAIFTADCNGLRRLVQPEEWVVHAETIQEERGCSQDEAAKLLHLHPSKLSRWATTMQWPERHKDAGKLLGHTHRYIICTEPDSAVQDALVRYATTPGTDGKLPGTEALRAMKKQLKGKKKPGRKAKSLRLTVDGLGIEMKLKGDDTVEVVAERLKALAKGLSRYKDLPPEALGGLAV